MKSLELQSVLNRTPAWIVRSGTGMLFIILILILIGSYILKYPDVITTNVTISTETPPITIYAKRSDYLSKLLVKDNDLLQKNDIIGLLHSSTNFEHLIILKHQLGSIEKKLLNHEMFALPSVLMNLQLGSLQQYYTDFSYKAREYLDFKKSSYRTQQILSLRTQLKGNTNYGLELNRKRIIVGKDFVISHKQFMRDSILFTKKVISASEYELSQSELYKSENNYESIKSEILNNQLKNNEIESQTKELETKNFENENLLLSAVYSSLNILKSQIAEWYLGNVIISPTSGEILFNNIYKENQYVVSGVPIFSIIPKNEDRVVGRIEIPIVGSGKVTIGQRVNIKLASFPYQEYGVLKAQIARVSPIPYETSSGLFYIAEINLPKKLITTYGIHLKFSQQLHGTADIITKDRRLIERFLDPIISIFQK